MHFEMHKLIRLVTFIESIWLDILIDMLLIKFDIMPMPDNQDIELPCVRFRDYLHSVMCIYVY